MLSIRELAQKTNQAYHEFLEVGTTRKKNDILLSIAKKIEEKKNFLTEQNNIDLENGKKAGLSGALIDRLALNEKRITGMINACHEIAAQNDPVGRVYDMNMRPEGFKVGKMRVPIGVIGIIYEARPNVTIEAATLCLKSGNAVILRGGSSAFHSNMGLVKVLQEALEENQVNPNLISYIETTDRGSIDEMVIQDQYIHLIIPRGGENLIRTVVEKSRIPVLKHYKGVCHVYVNEKADTEMAEKIALNAKIQRPAVCNAMETLLVDESIAKQFIPRIIKQFQQENVEIRGCEKTLRIYSENVKKATEEDWYAEYLDYILAVRVVENMDQAIQHINQYGSGHTESIITKEIDLANKFVNRVDSSSIIINATTRLSDGGIYGLGAEIGISTDKLHSRGPMGADDLTTYKWIVLGEGHIRE